MSSRRGRQSFQAAAKKAKVEQPFATDTRQQNSIENDFPPLSQQRPQYSLTMPLELLNCPCNTSLFGSYCNNYIDQTPNLAFHSQKLPYSSPFASTHSSYHAESLPQKLEQNMFPVWNFALMPTDRTNYSSSASSSCAESQSSNEGDV